MVNHNKKWHYEAGWFYLGSLLDALIELFNHVNAGRGPFFKDDARALHRILCATRRRIIEGGHAEPPSAPGDRNGHEECRCPNYRVRKGRTHCEVFERGCYGPCYWFWAYKDGMEEGLQQGIERGKRIAERKEAGGCPKKS